MRTPMIVAVCGLSALLLGACERDRLNPPVPRVEPSQAGNPMQNAGTNTTVPSAETVLSPAAETPKPAATGVTENKSMTRAEDATGMPLAGQANDHSAPVGAARRASGP